MGLSVSDFTFATTSSCVRSFFESTRTTPSLVRNTVMLPPYIPISATFALMFSIMYRSSRTLTSLVGIADCCADTAVVMVTNRRTRGNIPLLALRQGGVAERSKNFAKHPLTARPGWFSELIHRRSRKTTPAASASVASRNFFDDAALPSLLLCKEGNRALLRFIHGPQSSK